MRRKRRISISDLSKEAQEKIRNQYPCCTTNRKQGTAYAGEGSNKVDPMATPVHIRIHSKRKRLGDACEGYDAKPVIDGIVRSGLLPDDSPEYVPQPVHQTHSASKEEETIIIIETI